MKLTTVLTAAAALGGGYVLGAAAGQGRYRQIRAGLDALVHHPRVQQLLFDLAGTASSTASHVPGPAADLVDAAATRVQETSPTPTTTLPQSSRSSREQSLP